MLFEFYHAIVIDVGQHPAGKSILYSRATAGEGMLLALPSVHFRNLTLVIFVFPQK